MNDHTLAEMNSGKSDSAAVLEARLAEIEAGILDPYAFTSRTLIQSTFPHSAKAGEKIVLVNGNMRVTVLLQSSGDRKTCVK